VNEHPTSLRRLRVATLNLWNVSEPYAARTALVREQLSRLAADVVGLQEVFDSPPSGIRQAHELAADDGYHVVLAAEAPRQGGMICNAVLSRYPIVGHEVRALPHRDGDFVRSALRADLALPEGLLHFFCTHLSYRADESCKREGQVLALEEFVREASRELPRVIVGDFNADPDSTEMRFLTGKASIAGKSAYYQDAAAITGAASPTWSARNPYTEVYGEGDRRIDYVLVSHARSDRTGMVHSCRRVFDHPSAEGVFPSDHFGVFAEIWIGRKS